MLLHYHRPDNTPQGRNIKSPFILQQLSYKWPAGKKGPGETSEAAHLNNAGGSVHHFSENPAPWNGLSFHLAHDHHAGVHGRGVCSMYNVFP